jgi:hypothetical protein
MALTVQERLMLFIEKADELNSLPFTKYIKTGKEISTTITFSSKGKPYSKAKGPRDDSLKSFILTFRFFIQNDSSLRALDKVISDDLGISEKLKLEVKRVREKLDDFLHSPNELFVDNGISYTNWQVVDAMIYGYYAHANAEQRRLFKSWEQDPFTFAAIRQIFISTLMAIFDAIDYIAQLSKKELNLI